MLTRIAEMVDFVLLKGSTFLVTIMNKFDSIPSSQRFSLDLNLFVSVLAFTIIVQSGFKRGSFKRKGNMINPDLCSG